MDASEACAPSSTGAPGTLCPRPLRPRLTSPRLISPSCSYPLETPVDSLSFRSWRRCRVHTLQLCSGPLLFVNVFMTNFPGHGLLFFFLFSTMILRGSEFPMWESGLSLSLSLPVL